MKKEPYHLTPKYPFWQSEEVLFIWNILERDQCYQNISCNSRIKNSVFDKLNLFHRGDKNILWFQNVNFAPVYCQSQIGYEHFNQISFEKCRTSFANFLLYWPPFPVVLFLIYILTCIPNWLTRNMKSTNYVTLSWIATVLHIC